MDSDIGLQHLKTLLEFNSNVLANEGGLEVGDGGNEEIRDAVAELAERAREQKRELEGIIGDWKRARRPKPQVIRIRESLLSNRELVESWIELKSTSAQLYRTAAEEAPTFTLRRRLEALAIEEEAVADDLRRLL